MFRYWHPNTIFIGQDLLAVAPSIDGLHTDYLIKHSKEIGEVKKLSVQRGEKNITTVFYRFGGGYTPICPGNIALNNTHTNK